MNQSGHTLLEVVVSVLLLAVTLVPLFELYPPVLSANEARRDSVLLSAVASGKLEELGQGLRGGTVGVGTGSQACASLQGCRLEWGVQDVAAHPAAGWLRRAWALACVDRDGSATCDPDEPQVRYETRVTSRP